MTTEPDDSIAAFKALAIFSTLRSNLALADAFLRCSMIEESNYKHEDLGFLAVAPGEDQLTIHNRSVTLIVVALLYQSLENYLNLVRIRPGLVHSELEGFFDSLGSRRRFIDGMKQVRDGVFHVRSLRSWRRREVRHFGEVCEKRGGSVAVMSELRELLYDFTERVFLGELRIWPDVIYADIERQRQARPDLVEKLESGEIDFFEFMEAEFGADEA